MLTALEWDLNEAQQAWREDGFDEGLQKGIEKGIQKGIEKGTLQVAVNLIRMGIDFDKVRAATNLSIAKIEELAAEI